MLDARSTRSECSLLDASARSQNVIAAFHIPLRTLIRTYRTIRRRYDMHVCSLLLLFRVNIMLKFKFKALQAPDGPRWVNGGRRHFQMGER